jgi:Lon protease-like protein
VCLQEAVEVVQEITECTLLRTSAVHGPGIELEKSEGLVMVQSVDSTPEEASHLNKGFSEVSEPQEKEPAIPGISDGLQNNTDSNYFQQKGGINVEEAVSRYSGSPETITPHQMKDMVLRDKRQDQFNIPDILEIVRTKLAEETQILTCQICYHVFLDPVTTRCGHTFCWNCLARSVDSSQQCPACRTEFPWQFPTGVAMHHDPLQNWNQNYSLGMIISTCWPDEVAIRREAAGAEEQVIPKDMDLPLFVCCVSFPTQPTYLQVFEPRYRLMLRRIMKSESRSFGMILFERDASPPMVSHATVLQIERVVYTDDREIILKTIGLGRVKICNTDMRDGYWVASAEALQDLTVLEESALEQQEVGFMRALDPALHQLNFDPTAITLDWAATASTRNASVISRLLTTELLALAMDYVSLIQSRTDPTIQQSIIEERGPPPLSPAEFSWWFASVMRMSDEDGVVLLSEDSPRGRMKILVSWILKRVRPRQGR